MTNNINNEQQINEQKSTDQGALTTKKFNTKALIKKILTYVVIAGILFFTLLPFYIMFETSFKVISEAAGKFTWFPKVGSVQGYVAVFNSTFGNFFASFGNTLLIAIPSMLVGLIVSTMSAYTFAKRNFAGKNILFWILLITMMMPGTITLMPQYMIFGMINWVDTVLPLMAPSFFGSATCVFFMRQFISGLPDSLIEAAKVDGLNHFQIFIKIILPLSIPALISQGLLWFLGSYNDYIGPLMYLTSPSKYTVQIFLSFLSSSTGASNVPAIMAGSIVTLLPIFIAYACLQKYFISGIAVSGMKA